MNPLKKITVSLKSLKAIKKQVFDANDRKHPSLRMVLAWRKLCNCKQQEDEDLMDYHRRFIGLIEMVESSYGDLKPKDDATLERRKLISMMFMEGVDKKQYGHLLKNLETDYSLGSKDVCPEGIEDALQILILFSEKALKKKKKNLNMVQAGGACWECGSTEHLKKDCPKHKAKMAKKEKDDDASSLQAKLELEQELAKRNEEDDGSDSSSLFWGAIAVFEDLKCRWPQQQAWQRSVLDGRTDPVDP